MLSLSDASHTHYFYVQNRCKYFLVQTLYSIAFFSGTWHFLPLNISLKKQKTGLEGVDWIYLAQDRKFIYQPSNWPFSMDQLYKFEKNQTEDV
jgi:hypothetical protein